MKRTIIFIIILFLHHYLPVFSQVKEPVIPDIPEINSNIDLQNFKFKVRIAVQGKTGVIEGDIVLNSGILVTPDKRSINIKDISKITILAWEKRSKMNKHSFYPSRYELLFGDFRKVISNGNIESLNRIRIIKNKKAGYIYSYYYDYYKTGNWVNSGVSDFDASFTRPAEGCAVSIELIQ